MRNANRLIHGATGLFTPALTVAALAVLLMTGCKSGNSGATASSKATTSSATSAAPAAPATPPAPPTPAVAPAPPPPPTPVVAPVVVRPTVRIKTGVTAAFTDSAGNTWLADQGFADGETTERAADLAIANTKDPAIYRSERYLMTAFSYPLPNGKYTVKLHFAETYEGISGPGERVFSFNVEGQEFKDFDVFVKAGGVQKAYVETVKVNIADGKLDITFTSNIENPEINGIEIIPAP